MACVCLIWLGTNKKENICYQSTICLLESLIFKYIQQK